MNHLRAPPGLRAQWEPLNLQSVGENHEWSRNFGNYSGDQESEGSVERLCLQAVKSDLTLGSYCWVDIVEVI